jgi:hypothetical protein
MARILPRQWSQKIRREGIPNVSQPAGPWVLLLAAEGTPNSELSTALIDTIFKGSLLAPAHIIGLTEYREVEAAARAYYDKHLFTLETYDREDLGWADRICNKIIYFALSKVGQRSNSTGTISLQM